MEQLQPTFLSRETQEDIRFYKDWIREALLDGILIEAALGRDLLERVSGYGFDSEVDRQLATLKEAWSNELREKARETAEDLQENIFGKGLFRVGIIVGDETHAIDGVMLHDGERIVPVVADAAYTGPIDDVLFDR